MQRRTSKKKRKKENERDRNCLARLKRSRENKIAFDNSMRIHHYRSFPIYLSLLCFALKTIKENPLTSSNFVCVSNLRECHSCAAMEPKRLPLERFFGVGMRWTEEGRTRELIGRWTEGNYYGRTGEGEVRQMEKKSERKGKEKRDMESLGRRKKREKQTDLRGGIRS